MIDRVSKYSKKLRVLRQIMSNKARTYGRVQTSVKVGTVLVSSFLTFFGFTGLDKITQYAQRLAPLGKADVELAFNIGVFGLFVLIILALVFRFSEREAEAQRAIVSVTHLVNQVDDLIARAEFGPTPTANEVDLIRGKYDVLIESLPANTDKEYLLASRDLNEKETKRPTLQLLAQDLFSADCQKRTVEALVRKSQLLTEVLDVLRRTDDRLYLGGGPVRNAVWDFLHGYPAATAPDDIDVIYFDLTSADKVRDQALQKKLQAIMPNVKWSVKNQARMHLVNAEAAYESLEDAIRKWPETATAMVIRPSSGGALEFVAPFGFDDLFRLVVQPTPHFRGKLEKYRERIIRKEWRKLWPKLSVYELA